MLLRLFTIFTKWNIPDPATVSQQEMENALLEFTIWNPAYALTKAIDHIRYVRVNDNPKIKRTISFFDQKLDIYFLILNFFV